MRTLAIVAVLSAVGASPAAAICVGSSTFATCTDAAGSDYTVQHVGGQTLMNGYNGQTGGRGSRDSTTLGNSTYVVGTTNGRALAKASADFQQSSHRLRHS